MAFLNQQTLGGIFRYYLQFEQNKMNFDEEFSQPQSFQPSLPDIIQEDKLDFSEGKSFKFQILVKFFNRFSNMRGIKKSNYVKQFLKILFKADRSPSFVYPIIRLMLPSDDRERGNYGLKQKNLSKAVSQSLSLTKQDYLRLHHFKNPSFHKNGIGIGDFSLCTYDVVKSFCKEQSTLTINDLNSMLDELVSSSKAQLNVFRKLFTVCTAEEIKWIIRIILKDLKISIKIETVLGAFHADAHDFFNLTNSLLETCKKFEDASISLDDEIKMFFPIRPMLAGKKKINFFQDNHKKYFVETKFDGERLQAHKKGSQVKLFSRNAVDYSKTYEQFVDNIRNYVEADECILDGQIIVIEKDTLKMIPFGLNKVIAVNKNKESDEHRLCFKIFDVLWLKEEGEEINLMKFELQQRKEILSKIVKEKEGVIEVVKHQQMSDYDEILKRFSDSLDRNQQGIMLKDPNSMYFPKERGSNWVKLKGDYIEGLTDTLDLIILGGYFGDTAARHGSSNHWTDQLTSFLLGVIDRIDTVNPQIAYAIPFAKVGTGYSRDQLSILRQRLRDNLSKNQAKFKPPYLECKWKPSLQDKPDCWVTSLSRSVVLQVKAAELIVSDSYPTGHTLRFPRVVKIRYDKDWNEAQTTKNIQEMTDTTLYSKHLKRRLQESDSDGEKGQEKQISDKATKKTKKDKEAKRDGVYEQYFGFDMTDERILSHLFSGFEFCVFPFTTSKHTKHEIQRQIMLHAGEIVQNPMQTTQYIITDTIDFKMRAYQIQKNKKYTFIKPNYILNCINANKILRLSPLYLTILPQGNAKYYMQNFDRFGDSYSDYLDLRQLDQVVELMQGTFPINQKLMKEIDLKRRRAGKVSLCFGLSEVDKIKLKMNDNILVHSFQDKPNTIIIQGRLNEQEEGSIREYIDQQFGVTIESAQDLRATDIL